MSNSIRTIVAIVAAALVVALIIWARGNPHHHGLDVGSLGRGPAVVAPATPGDG
jgi:hypothetical protein